MTTQEQIDAMIAAISAGNVSLAAAMDHAALMIRKGQAGVSIGRSTPAALLACGTGLRAYYIRQGLWAQLLPGEFALTPQGQVLVAQAKRSL